MLPCRLTRAWFCQVDGETEFVTSAFVPLGDALARRAAGLPQVGDVAAVAAGQAPGSAGVAGAYPAVAGYPAAAAQPAPGTVVQVPSAPVAPPVYDPVPTGTIAAGGHQVDAETLAAILAADTHTGPPAHGMTDEQLARAYAAAEREGVGYAPEQAPRQPDRVDKAKKGKTCVIM